MANVVEIIIKAFDQTRAGFTSSLRNVQDFQKAANAMTNVAVATGGAVASAFVAMTKSAIDTSDELGKMAQRVNVPVEALTGLVHAANSANIETASFEKGLGTLNKTLAAAATNTASDAAAAFQAVGVAVKDSTGRIRPAEQILLDLAQKFSGFEDGAEKAALATQLFGKAGADLLPMLNLGRNGIVEIGGEVMAVTKGMASQADEFNSNLSRLKSDLAQTGFTIAQELLPHLLQFSTWMVKLERDHAFFAAAAMTVADVLKGMAVAVNLVWTTFKVLGAFLGTIAAILVENVIAPVKSTIQLFGVWGGSIRAIISHIGQLGRSLGDVGLLIGQVASGDFEEAWVTAGGLIQDTEVALKRIGSTLSDTVKQSADVVVTNYGQAFDNAAAMAKGALEGMKADVQSFSDFSMGLFSSPLQVNKETGGGPKPLAPLVQNVTRTHQSSDLQQYLALLAQIEADGLTGEAKLRAEAEKTLLERLDKLNRLKISDEEYFAGVALSYEAFETRKVQIAAESFEAQKAFADQLRVEAMDGIGQKMAADDLYFQERLKQIAQIEQTEEQALEMVALAQKNYANARVRTEQETLSAVSSIFGNMAAAAQAFGKKGFAAYKAFASAQALIDTYASAVAAYKSMSGIPYVGAYLGAAAAAAAIAFGMARVAQINSTQPAGAAHGGMDYVPGEATYLLQQGERVVQPSANRDLTEFLDARGGSGGSNGPVQVTIMLDRWTLGKALFDMGQSGELTIPTRAVV